MLSPSLGKGIWFLSPCLVAGEPLANRSWTSSCPYVREKWPSSVMPVFFLFHVCPVMVNHEATAAENSSEGTARKLTEPRLWTNWIQTIHHKRLEKQMLLLCPSTYNLQKRNIINWKNKGRVLHSEIKELTSFLMQQDSALVKRSFLSPEVVKSCPCFHAALLSSSA